VPPVSVAALAAFLAALLLFFPVGIAVVVAFGGPPLGCCAAGTSEHFSAAVPPELGVADRAVLFAEGDSYLLLQECCERRSF
jgi:hypothetical protein